MTNPVERLHAAGQSIWIDSINRTMVSSGTLARYVEELAVTGLTSNPTILGHAMAASHDYDRSLRRWVGEGVTDAQDLVYAVAFEDLGAAASLFQPTWEKTSGVDGYVSIEVPPDLAYDAAATTALARRLHDEAGFPNLLVKIPATPEGLTAMEETVAAGIGVNVTLIFSDAQYLQTAEASLRELERRLAKGEHLDVPSVASVFVSRWDKVADPLLPSHLHATLGLAMAKKAYASFSDLLSGERWAALAAAGARPQRLLWASTSAKDPGLTDDHYVANLVAPGTVDTVPEQTLLAFADHGNFDALLEADYAQAEAQVAAVAAEGVDVDALAESLQRQGAKAFSADWAALVEVIGAKVAGM
ncbi:MAG: transaldolase [Actinomycetota bacterium]|jgi:transaldolase|nr:transaldolase [Actinomycetota bacterium]